MCQTHTHTHTHVSAWIWFQISSVSSLIVQLKCKFTAQTGPCGVQTESTHHVCKCAHKRTPALALVSAAGFSGSLNRASYSPTWWRIMIDRPEPDLRQTEQETLNCAAGNYFVLEEKKKEGGEGEKERHRGRAGGGGICKAGVGWGGGGLWRVDSGTWWWVVEVCVESCAGRRVSCRHCCFSDALSSPFSFFHSFNPSREDPQSNHIDFHLLTQYPLRYCCILRPANCTFSPIPASFHVAHWARSCDLARANVAAAPSK